MTLPKNLAVASIATKTIFGMAEGLWESDLDPNQLFETISQTINDALERDYLSDYGMIVRVTYVQPSPHRKSTLY